MFKPLKFSSDNSRVHHDCNGGGLCYESTVTTVMPDLDAYRNGTMTQSASKGQWRYTVPGQWRYTLPVTSGKDSDDNSAEDLLQVSEGTTAETIQADRDRAIEEPALISFLQKFYGDGGVPANLRASVQADNPNMIDVIISETQNGVTTDVGKIVIMTYGGQYNVSQVVDLKTHTQAQFMYQTGYVLYGVSRTTCDSMDCRGGTWRSQIDNITLDPSSGNNTADLVSLVPPLRSDPVRVQFANFADLLKQASAMDLSPAVVNALSSAKSALGSFSFNFSYTSAGYKVVMTNPAAAAGGLSRIEFVIHSNGNIDPATVQLTYKGSTGDLRPEGKLLFVAMKRDPEGTTDAAVLGLLDQIKVGSISASGVAGFSYKGEDYTASYDATGQARLQEVMPSDPKVKIIDVNGVPTLEIQCYVLGKFVVQSSPQVTGGTWSEVRVINVTAPGVVTFVDPNAGTGTKTYRILYETQAISELRSQLLAEATAALAENASAITAKEETLRAARSAVEAEIARLEGIFSANLQDLESLRLEIEALLARQGVSAAARKSATDYLQALLAFRNVSDPEGFASFKERFFSALRNNATGQLEADLGILNAQQQLNHEYLSAVQEALSYEGLRDRVPGLAPSAIVPLIDPVPLSPASMLAALIKQGDDLAIRLWDEALAVPQRVDDFKDQLKQSISWYVTSDAVLIEESDPPKYRISIHPPVGEGDVTALIPDGRLDWMSLVVNEDLSHIYLENAVFEDIGETSNALVLFETLLRSYTTGTPIEKAIRAAGDFSTLTVTDIQSDGNIFFTLGDKYYKIYLVADQDPVILEESPVMHEARLRAAALQSALQLPGNLADGYTVRPITELATGFVIEISYIGSDPLATGRLQYLQVMVAPVEEAVTLQVQAMYAVPNWYNGSPLFNALKLLSGSAGSDADLQALLNMSALNVTQVNMNDDIYFALQGQNYKTYWGAGEEAVLSKVITFDVSRSFTQLQQTVAGAEAGSTIRLMGSGIMAGDFLKLDHVALDVDASVTFKIKSVLQISSVADRLVFEMKFLDPDHYELQGNAGGTWEGIIDYNVEADGTVKRDGVVLGTGGTVTYIGTSDLPAQDFRIMRTPGLNIVTSDDTTTINIGFSEAGGYELQRKSGSTWVTLVDFNVLQPGDAVFIEPAGVTSAQYRIQKTVMPPSVVTSSTPYAYDATAAQTMDYAYALLDQEGISTAVIVDQLTASDLQRLSSLNKEVGIAVMAGQIVLFTSSSSHEIRLAPSVAELVSHATFITHIHTEATGPSTLDIANAGALPEYLINSLGQVFLYDHQGIQSSTGSLTDIASALDQAVAAWQAQPGDEAQARSWLNQFINGVSAPEEDTVSFRADGVISLEIEPTQRTIVMTLPRTPSGEVTYNLLTSLSGAAGGPWQSLTTTALDGPMTDTIHSFMNKNRTMAFTDVVAQDDPRVYKLVKSADYEDFTPSSPLVIDGGTTTRNVKGPSLSMTGKLPGDAMVVIGINNQSYVFAPITDTCTGSPSTCDWSGTISNLMPGTNKIVVAVQNMAGHFSETQTFDVVYTVPSSGVTWPAGTVSTASVVLSGTNASLPVNTRVVATVTRSEPAWSSTTAYHAGDFVKNGGLIYTCLTAHTSGTFANDLKDHKWVLAAEQIPPAPRISTFLTDASGHWTGSIVLGAGANDISVEVKDVLGNTSAAQIQKVTYALAAPKDVFAVFPESVTKVTSDGSPEGTSSSFILGGTTLPNTEIIVRVGDPDKSNYTDQTYFFYPDNALNEDGSQNWTGRIALNMGDNTLSITARDIATGGESAAFVFHAVRNISTETTSVTAPVANYANDITTDSSFFLEGNVRPSQFVVDDLLFDLSTNPFDEDTEYGALPEGWDNKKLNDVRKAIAAGNAVSAATWVLALNDIIDEKLSDDFYTLCDGKLSFNASDRQIFEKIKNGYYVSDSQIGQLQRKIFETLFTDSLRKFQAYVFTTADILFDPSEITTLDDFPFDTTSLPDNWDTGDFDLIRQMLRNKGSFQFVEADIFVEADTTCDPKTSLELFDAVLPSGWDNGVLDNIRGGDEVSKAEWVDMLNDLLGQRLSGDVYTEANTEGDTKTGTFDFVRGDLKFDLSTNPFDEDTENGALPADWHKGALDSVPDSWVETLNQILQNPMSQSAYEMACGYLDGNYKCAGGISGRLDYETREILTFIQQQISWYNDYDNLAASIDANLGIDALKRVNRAILDKYYPSLLESSNGPFDFTKEDLLFTIDETNPTNPFDEDTENEALPADWHKGALDPVPNSQEAWVEALNQILQNPMSRSAYERACGNFDTNENKCDGWEGLDYITLKFLSEIQYIYIYGGTSSDDDLANQIFNDSTLGTYALKRVNRAILDKYYPSLLESSNGPFDFTKEDLLFTIDETNPTNPTNPFDEDTENEALPADWHKGALDPVPDTTKDWVDALNRILQNPMSQSAYEMACGSFDVNYKCAGGISEGLDYETLEILTFIQQRISWYDDYDNLAASIYANSADLGIDALARVNRAILDAYYSDGQVLKPLKTDTIKPSVRSQLSPEALDLLDRASSKLYLDAQQWERLNRELLEAFVSDSTKIRSYLDFTESDLLFEDYTAKHLTNTALPEGWDKEALSPQPTTQQGWVDKLNSLLTKPFTIHTYDAALTGSYRVTVKNTFDPELQKLLSDVQTNPDSLTTTQMKRLNRAVLELFFSDEIKGIRTNKEVTMAVWVDALNNILKGVPTVTQKDFEWYRTGWMNSDVYTRAGTFKFITDDLINPERITADPFADMLEVGWEGSSQDTKISDLSFPMNGENWAYFLNEIIAGRFSETAYENAYETYAGNTEIDRETRDLLEKVHGYIEAGKYEDIGVVFLTKDEKMYLNRRILEIVGGSEFIKAEAAKTREIRSKLTDDIKALLEKKLNGKPLGDAEKRRLNAALLSIYFPGMVKPLLKISKILITVDGSDEVIEASVNDNLNWVANINSLHPGSNVLSIVAQDSAGHLSAASTIGPIRYTIPLTYVSSFPPPQVATENVMLRGMASSSDQEICVMVNGVIQDCVAPSKITRRWQDEIRLTVGTNTLAVVERRINPTADEFVSSPYTGAPQSTADDPGSIAENPTTEAFFDNSAYDQETELPDGTYFGLKGSWVQVKNKLSTEYSMKLVDGNTTYVVSGLTSSFKAQEGSQYSKRVQLTDEEHFGQTGNWVQIQKGLNSKFKPKSQSAPEFSMELKSGNDLYVANNLDSSFEGKDHSKYSIFGQPSQGEEWMKIREGLSNTFEDPGNAKYSMWRESGTTSQFGKTGPWIQVKTGLSSSFEEVADTTVYSMRLQQDETMYVVSGLTSAFASRAGTAFSKQIEQVGVTKYGITGNWIKVSENLTDAFTKQGSTAYSMRLEVDGTTYLATGLTATFEAQKGTQYSKQVQLLGVDRFGQTGDWVEITGNLTSRFESPEDGAPVYSMRLKKGNDLFMATDLASGFVPQNGVSKFSKLQLVRNATYFGKTGDWFKVLSGLSETNTFDLSASIVYSMQLNLNGTVYLANNLNSSFGDQSSSVFSTYAQLGSASYFSNSGTWTRVTNGLTNTFQVPAETPPEYSMRLDTGSVVYVASGLSRPSSVSQGFTALLSSRYTTFRRLPGTTFFDQSGDWVQVTSNLSSSFAESLGTAKFSMQLYRGGKTYVAEELTSAFAEPEQASSKFSIREQLYQETLFGQTTNWLKLTKGLSNTFTATDQSKDLWQIGSNEETNYYGELRRLPEVEYEIPEPVVNETPRVISNSDTLTLSGTVSEPGMSIEVSVNGVLTTIQPVEPQQPVIVGDVTADWKIEYDCFEEGTYQLQFSATGDPSVVKVDGEAGGWRVWFDAAVAGPYTLQKKIRGEWVTISQKNVAESGRDYIADPDLSSTATAKTDYRVVYDNWKNVGIPQMKTPPEGGDHDQFLVPKVTDGSYKIVFTPAVINTTVKSGAFWKINYTYYKPGSYQLQRQNAAGGWDNVGEAQIKTGNGTECNTPEACTFQDDVKERGNYQIVYTQVNPQIMKISSTQPNLTVQYRYWLEGTYQLQRKNGGVWQDVESPQYKNTGTMGTFEINASDSNPDNYQIVYTPVEMFDPNPPSGAAPSRTINYNHLQSGTYQLQKKDGNGVWVNVGYPQYKQGNGTDGVFVDNEESDTVPIYRIVFTPPARPAITSKEKYSSWQIPYSFHGSGTYQLQKKDTDGNWLDIGSPQRKTGSGANGLFFDDSGSAGEYRIVYKPDAYQWSAEDVNLTVGTNMIFVMSKNQAGMRSDAKQLDTIIKLPATLVEPTITIPVVSTPSSTVVVNTPIFTFTGTGGEGQYVCFEGISDAKGDPCTKVSDKGVWSKEVLFKNAGLNEITIYAKAYGDTLRTPPITIPVNFTVPVPDDPVIDPNFNPIFNFANEQGIAHIRGSLDMSNPTNQDARIRIDANGVLDSIDCWQGDADYQAHCVQGSDGSYITPYADGTWDAYVRIPFDSDGYAYPDAVMLTLAAYRSQEFDLGDFSVSYAVNSDPYQALLINETNSLSPGRQSSFPPITVTDPLAGITGTAQPGTVVCFQDGGNRQCVYPDKDGRWQYNFVLPPDNGTYNISAISYSVLDYYDLDYRFTEKDILFSPTTYPFLGEQNLLSSNWDRGALNEIRKSFLYNYIYMANDDSEIVDALSEEAKVMLQKAVDEGVEVLTPDELIQLNKELLTVIATQNKSQPIWNPTVTDWVNGLNEALKVGMTAMDYVNARNTPAVWNRLDSATQTLLENALENLPLSEEELIQLNRGVLEAFCYIDADKDGNADLIRSSQDPSRNTVFVPVVSGNIRYTVKLEMPVASPTFTQMNGDIVNPADLQTVTHPVVSLNGSLGNISQYNLGARICIEGSSDKDSSGNPVTHCSGAGIPQDPELTGLEHVTDGWRIKFTYYGDGTYTLQKKDQLTDDWVTVDSAYLKASASGSNWLTDNASKQATLYRLLYDPDLAGAVDESGNLKWTDTVLLGQANGVNTISAYTEKVYNNFFYCSKRNDVGDCVDDYGNDTTKKWQYKATSDKVALSINFELPIKQPAINEPTTAGNYIPDPDTIPTVTDPRLSLTGDAEPDSTIDIYSLSLDEWQSGGLDALTENYRVGSASATDEGKWAADNVFLYTNGSQREEDVLVIRSSKTYTVTFNGQDYEYQVTSDGLLNSGLPWAKVASHPDWRRLDVKLPAKGPTINQSSQTITSPSFTLTGTSEPSLTGSDGTSTETDLTLYKCNSEVCEPVGTIDKIANSPSGVVSQVWGTSWPSGPANSWKIDARYYGQGTYILQRKTKDGLWIDLSSVTVADAEGNIAFYDTTPEKAAAYQIVKIVDHIQNGATFTFTYNEDGIYALQKSTDNENWVDVGVSKTETLAYGTDSLTYAGTADAKTKYRIVRTKPTGIWSQPLTIKPEDCEITRDEGTDPPTLTYTARYYVASSKTYTFGEKKVPAVYGGKSDTIMLSFKVSVDDPSFTTIEGVEVGTAPTTFSDPRVTVTGTAGAGATEVCLAGATIKGDSCKTFTQPVLGTVTSSGGSEMDSFTVGGAIVRNQNNERRFQVSIPQTAGAAQYRIESAESLNGPWAPQATVLADPGDSTTWLDDRPLAKMRFYRVVPIGSGSGTTVNYTFSGPGIYELQRRHVVGDVTTWETVTTQSQSGNSGSGTFTDPTGVGTTAADYQIIYTPTWSHDVLLTNNGKNTLTLISTKKSNFGGSELTLTSDEVKLELTLKLPVETPTIDQTTGQTVTNPFFTLSGTSDSNEAHDTNANGVATEIVIYRDGEQVAGLDRKDINADLIFSVPPSFSWSSSADGLAFKFLYKGAGTYQLQKRDSATDTWDVVTEVDVTASTGTGYLYDTDASTDDEYRIVNVKAPILTNVSGMDVSFNYYGLGQYMLMRKDSEDGSWFYVPGAVFNATSVSEQPATLIDTLEGTAYAYQIVYDPSVSESGGLISGIWQNDILLVDPKSGVDSGTHTLTVQTHKTYSFDFWGQTYQYKVDSEQKTIDVTFNLLSQAPTGSLPPTSSSPIMDLVVFATPSGDTTTTIKGMVTGQDANGNVQQQDVTFTESYESLPSTISFVDDPSNLVENRLKFNYTDQGVGIYRLEKRSSAMGDWVPVTGAGASVIEKEGFTEQHSLFDAGSQAYEYRIVYTRSPIVTSRGGFNGAWDIAFDYFQTENEAVTYKLQKRNFAGGNWTDTGVTTEVYSSGYGSAFLTDPSWQSAFEYRVIRSDEETKDVSYPADVIMPDQNGDRKWTYQLTYYGAGTYTLQRCTSETDNACVNGSSVTVTSSKGTAFLYDIAPTKGNYYKVDYVSAGNTGVWQGQILVPSVGYNSITLQTSTTKSYTYINPITGDEQTYTYTISSPETTIDTTVTLPADSVSVYPEPFETTDNPKIHLQGSAPVGSVVCIKTGQSGFNTCDSDPNTPDVSPNSQGLWIYDYFYAEPGTYNVEVYIKQTYAFNYDPSNPDNNTEPRTTLCSTGEINCYEYTVESEKDARPRFNITYTAGIPSPGGFVVPQTWNEASTGSTFTLNGSISRDAPLGTHVCVEVWSGAVDTGTLVRGGGNSGCVDPKDSPSGGDRIWTDEWDFNEFGSGDYFIRVQSYNDSDSKNPIYSAWTTSAKITYTAKP